MGFTAKTTDERSKYDAFVEQMKQARVGAHVEIGITEKDGQKRATTRDPETKTHPTLAQIATWNEFGTVGRDGNVHTPRRSFIGDTVDANRERYFQTLDKLREGIAKGKWSAAQALGLLGQQIRADIINRINAGIDPANAPSTIAAKGSSKPLIRTGQLKAAVNYVVKIGKVDYARGSSGEQIA